VTVGQLVSLIGKLGGLSLAGLGVNAHSLSEMTVGAALAVVLHSTDSIFNSPPGAAPPL